MTNEPRFDEEFGRLRKMLARAVPPVANSELQRDLWPLLLERIEEPPMPLRLSWFDWALLGVAAAALLFFPALLPALLYHL